MFPVSNLSETRKQPLTDRKQQYTGSGLRRLLGRDRFFTVFCRGAMVVAWLSIALISLDHLVPFSSLLSQLSTRFLGFLGWGTALVTIFCLGRGHLRAIGSVALLFFLLGLVIGSYLEPPADPLEHLRRIHEENCGKMADEVAPVNRGLWHYSMAGLVLCTDAAQVKPVRMLWKIRIVNGLFWALASAVLFLVAIKIGLPHRWSFLSILICFLFFGTNRFSYFRYYSLAPTFTSMFIYWLWGVYLVMQENRRRFLLLAFCGMFFLPVLWTNHRQEGVFLVLLLGIAILVNVWLSLAERGNTCHQAGTGTKVRCWGPLAAYILFLFIILALLPQSADFRAWLAGVSIRHLGAEYYKYTWHFRHGLYLGGTSHALRVRDTLGITGQVLGPVLILYFWPGLVRFPVERKLRITLLAILPFIGYYTPFLHLIWASNVYVAEYYRLCYASMFWLLFSHFLYGLEQPLSRLVRHFCKARSIAGGK